LPYQNNKPQSNRPQIGRKNQRTKREKINQTVRTRVVYHGPAPRAAFLALARSSQSPLAGTEIIGPINAIAWAGSEESTLLYVLSHTAPHTNLHINKSTEA
jgi:hypothetical protein